MNLEDAIYELKNMKDYCEDCRKDPFSDGIWQREAKALDMAIKALESKLEKEKRIKEKIYKMRFTVADLVISNLNVQKDSAYERTIIQKKVYLLKTINLDLGFLFVWSLYGPFSNNLSDYLEENFVKIQKADQASLSLSDQARFKIDQVNSLEKVPIEAGLTKMEWFILLSSVSYIANNPRSWKIEKESDIFENLQEQIPRYSKNQFELALKTLKEKNFL